MDALDHKIIARLSIDARVPLAQVAKEIGVATATVHQRVKRLRDRGEISGSRILLDYEKAGFAVTAVISVGLGMAGSLAEVAGKLEVIPFIQSCYAVTGEFDLMVVVRARSSTHLGEILEDIRQIIPGMSRTVIVLSTFFEGRVPPLEA